MANNFLSGSAWVRLYWALGNEVAVNQLGFTVLGGITFGQGLAESVGTVCKDAFTAQWAGKCSAAASLARVGVRDWRSANQPEFRDTGASRPGTGTGELLPRAAAVCLTLRTGLAGRSFRGRIYIPGADELQNSGSAEMLAATGTAAVAFMNAINTGLESLGLRLSVVSRPSDESFLIRRTFDSEGKALDEILSHNKAKPGAVTDVTAIESRTLAWEYQRRRGNTRGGGIALLEPVAKVSA